ncbi:MAG: hypothetical protein K2H85_02720, partial [Allobaculum sp.]|nr:hypothetical protein [Allobaculum sp.]
EEVNPDEIFAGEQQQFGVNITVPGEEEVPDIQPEEVIEDQVVEDQVIEESAGEEQVVLDQAGENQIAVEQLGSEVGSVFGSTFLQDIMNEYAEKAKEGEGENIVSEEQTDIEKSNGNDGLSGDLVPEEQQVDEKTSGVQTGQEKEVTPTMSLLREYQERRAAEIAEMEAGDKKNELMRLMESRIGDNMAKNIPQGVKPGEEYLDNILRLAQSGTGTSEKESDKLENEVIVGDGANDSLDASRNEAAIVVRSAEIEKSEAEKYLDSVLEANLANANNSAFSGFDSSMLASGNILNGVSEDLTPSNVFDENISRVEAREEGKSPAEKRIDAMLAALEEGRANKTSIVGGEQPRTQYKHVKSEQEKAMDKLLQEAMASTAGADFKGFDEGMFMISGSQEAVNSASEMLGLSSEESYKNYVSSQGARSPEEEKLDAMLLGKYSEPPAVVIEPLAPVIVVNRETSEEEQRMNEMLKNIGKDVPGVFGEEEKLKGPV